ncbi:RibD family protein [Luteolibacter pohnpeiensis]|uniref:RibD family protein n=1 Tax=Luteolibacter pohnpeiensis TaxID=454153 RepID=A0A934S5L3_9BACT|nr:RibD family protein [Luteolibacter pohnpeiensis]MBK1881685.1 RibD family protein [Luteolibacter pohnpeiensis]
MVRPRISTNFAISADGKISSIHHRPSGWTSKQDHQRLLELRQNADALMVGRGTLEHDQMTLTGPRNPLRCIISRTGELDPTHPIFSKPGGPIHLLVTNGEGKSLPQDPRLTIHTGTLKDFIHSLAETHHVKNLHCEGGGQLVNELAQLDLIDEFHLTVAAHTLFGGAESPTTTGKPANFLPASRHFKISYFEPRTDLGECFLSYSRA